MSTSQKMALAVLFDLKVMWAERCFLNHNLQELRILRLISEQFLFSFWALEDKINK